MPGQACFRVSVILGLPQLLRACAFDSGKLVSGLLRLSAMTGSGNSIVEDRDVVGGVVRKTFPTVSKLFACIVAMTMGCSSQPMPDPRLAADAFADAAARGDAEAIHSMLDEEARLALSPQDVRRLVADQRKELEDQAKAIRSKDARVKASATLRYADGEDVIVDLEDDGQFRIASADALPSGARTPEQALDKLRRVLARRSYGGLMRVLSSQTRGAMENELRSLVKALENPEELEVQQSGEKATVRLPGGHLIWLRREEGTWRIDDIQ